MNSSISRITPLLLTLTAVSSAVLCVRKQTRSVLVVRVSLHKLPKPQQQKRIVGRLAAYSLAESQKMLTLLGVVKPVSLMALFNLHLSKAQPITLLLGLLFQPQAISSMDLIWLDEA
jgi:hypothetical protein